MAIRTTNSRPGNIEKMLISSVLRHRELQIAFRQGITQSMFAGYTDEWHWIEDYYTRFHKHPSRKAFNNQFPAFSWDTVNDTEHLCEELKAIASRRTMQSAMREASDFLRTGNLDSAISVMQTSVLQAASMTGVYNDGDIFRDSEDIEAEYIATQERVANNGSAGIPFGFRAFDRRTGGGKPGELITCAARLGEGKSWLLTKWAANAAVLGHTVQFNSLEMPRAQVSARIYSMLAEYGGQHFKSNDLTMGDGFDREQFASFMKQLRKKLDGSLHVSDRARGMVTTTTIAAQIERLNPDIVFIDYIGLMGTKGAKDWASIGELSGELKSLAMTYGIPIVIAAQLNRERGVSKAGEPAGADAISQSDIIGQDSDTIVTVGRLSESVMKLKCVKNRHGRGNFAWHAHFDPENSVFKEVTLEKALELKALDREREVMEQSEEDDE